MSTVQILFIRILIYYVYNKCTLLQNVLKANEYVCMNKVKNSNNKFEMYINIKGKSVPLYRQLHTFLTTSAQYTLSAHG